MVIVCDTSPITNLWKIGHLDLLKDVFEDVVVPEAVYGELCRIPEQQQFLDGAAWIKVQKISDLVLFEKLLLKVDRGEAEAITLAMDLKSNLLIMDELKGRAIAEKMGFQVTGILGTLLRAKEKGLILHVKEPMDKLIKEAEFWIHPSLYSSVLKLAGES